ncbi:hypothetical protein WJX77_000157 [Trebouxia sp. C0004]
MTGLTRAQAPQQLQHQQEQDEADCLSAEALIPTNSLFCHQPSLVLSPDGCKIAVARRLKQTSYSTDISTQYRSYQPKGPNESTTVVQTSSNAGSQAPVGLCPEMNYRPSVVFYVGHVHIVGKHKTAPPHTHA